MAAPLAVAPLYRKGVCASGTFDPTAFFGLFPVATFNCVRLQCAPGSTRIVQRFAVKEVEDACRRLWRVPPYAIHIGKIGIAGLTFRKTSQQNGLIALPSVRQEAVRSVTPQCPVQPIQKSRIIGQDLQPLPVRQNAFRNCGQDAFQRSASQIVEINLQNCPPRNGQAGARQSLSRPCPTRRRASRPRPSRQCRDAPT